MNNRHESALQMMSGHGPELPGPDGRQNTVKNIARISTGHSQRAQSANEIIGLTESRGTIDRQSPNYNPDLVRSSRIGEIITGFTHDFMGKRTSPQTIDNLGEFGQHNTKEDEMNITLNGEPTKPAPRATYTPQYNQSESGFFAKIRAYRSSERARKQANRQARARRAEQVTGANIGLGVQSKWATRIARAKHNLNSWSEFSSGQIDAKQLTQNVRDSKQISVQKATNSVIHTRRREQFGAIWGIVLAEGFFTKLFGSKSNNVPKTTKSRQEKIAELEQQIKRLKDQSGSGS